MELIKNKRIGKVLLVVEGGKHEFNLLKKIFVDVLGYTQIEKRRDSLKYFQREGDIHSVVAIINTKTSNISSINEREYLDKVFEELIQQYDFDVNNSAIYYLFDRDPESNTNDNLIKELIDTLKNSRENENNMMGGLLILSYPSIEAYEISNFMDDSFTFQARLGCDLKKYMTDNAKIFSMNKISEESIVHAYNELNRYLLQQEISIDIDNIAETNHYIFEKEQQCLEDVGQFNVLSMLSCVLLDLGIIVEKS